MITQTAAIVLQVRQHGESGVLLTLFGEDTGLVRTLVKSGRKQAGILQPGNVLLCTFRKRLPQQLGTATVELLHPYAVLALQNGSALEHLHSICTLLPKALPEEQVYRNFFKATLDMLAHLAEATFSERLAYWELQLLLTMGYGLALRKEEAVPCEQDSPLAYISPNTGRAVSVVTGEPFKTKLLPLPELFGGPVCETDPVLQARSVTRFFLEKHLGRL